MSEHVLHLIAIGLVAWIVIALVVAIVVGRILRLNEDRRPGYLPPPRGVKRLP